MAAGLLRPGGSLGRGVPEGAPVVLERVELLADLAQPGANVGEGQRRPVGEVAFGGWAVPGDVAQREFGQCLGSVEPPGCRHALLHERIGVLAVGWASAADQPVQLGVRQQDHEQLPVVLDAALAQFVAELGAGEVAAVGQRPHDRGHGVRDRRFVEAVRGAQLLAGDPAHPGTCQVEQPAEVIGQHEVPRRAQHMGAQHRAAVQQVRQLGLVRALGARSHRPARLASVLRLHREQRTHHVTRRRGVRVARCWLRNRQRAMSRSCTTAPSLPAADRLARCQVPGARCVRTARFCCFRAAYLPLSRSISPSAETQENRFPIFSWTRNPRFSSCVRSFRAVSLDTL